MQVRTLAACFGVYRARGAMRLRDLRSWVRALSDETTQGGMEGQSALVASRCLSFGVEEAKVSSRDVSSTSVGRHAR
eukprot:578054-Alexandrium_andersonii.AAC.1